MRTLGAALLVLVALSGAAQADDDPFLVMQSDSRPHGEPWEVRIFDDGTVQQFIDHQTVPTMTMHVDVSRVAALHTAAIKADLLHVVWPPAHNSTSGMMSLLIHQGSKSNYVEWSGQPDGGEYKTARIHFAQVWVEVLQIIPSPNDWETPDFFSGWLK